MAENLTKGTRLLIKDMINKYDTTDRHVLCEHICFYLEDKFTGKALDYQLKRMGLETTGDVLRAIDEYLYTYNK